MTEPTALETIKTQKQAHAQAILESISATLDVVESQPELWFGGTPSTFTNLKNHLVFTGTQLAETFEITWNYPTVTTPPE